MEAVNFDMIFGAMSLALGLYALATAYGVFRSPGRRLKSLHFDRAEDGSWTFRVESRKPEPGAWRRLQEALEQADAQEKEAAQGKKVAKKAKSP